jgi:hypothetical protein
MRSAIVHRYMAGFFLRGRIEGMLPSMRRQIMVLFAQFGSSGSSHSPSSVWPKLLLGAGLVTIAVLIAYAIVRSRPRFSLRTLFITLTSVAVVLGLIVAVARWPSAGQANALKVARQWMLDQGHDPSTSEFSVEPYDAGWQVFIEYQPPTSGGFFTIRMDSQGKITEVLPGS